MEVVRNAGCNPKVLVVSANCDDNTVYRVECAGFDGFIDKGSETVDTVRLALKSVAERRPFFSDRFLRLSSRRRRNPHSFDKVLTNREQVVLAQLGGLRTDGEIADELKVSVHTAEKHRFNILEKLGLPSKPALVRWAVTQGSSRFPAGQPGGETGAGGAIR